MNITIHTTMCVASGNCGVAAARVFRNSEKTDGFVELLNPHPPESEWEAAREAEYLCPSGTIQINDHQIPSR